MFVCDCGNSYDNRSDIREHIRKCNSIVDVMPKCDDCLTSAFIFLQYGEKKICPTCALNYDEDNAKPFFGTILLNHLDIKHENILKNKVENLCKFFNINSLTEVGIDIILITFTPSLSAMSHMMSNKGELIFALTTVKGLGRNENLIFEYVIYHEMMHAIVTYNKELGITTKFLKPRTFVETFVGSTLEDIQVTKYSILNGFMPYMKDEIRRDFEYYKNLEVPKLSQINNLSDRDAFAGMLSLSYSYASELYFTELNISSHTNKQIKKNLKIIKRHVDNFDCDEIVERIKDLYRDNLARNDEDRISMYNRLLNDCDKWLDKYDKTIY